MRRQATAGCLTGRDEIELGPFVAEFPDGPWAGDPVDLCLLARDPSHFGILLKLPDENPDPRKSMFPEPLLMVMITRYAAF